MLLISALRKPVQTNKEKEVRLIPRAVSLLLLAVLGVVRILGTWGAVFGKFSIGAALNIWYKY